MNVLSTFPSKPLARDQWIFERRGRRNNLDPSTPYAFFVEDEVQPNGDNASVATIFLTNRECPWRCTMCDLWKNTTTETVPLGSIPRQIQHALSRLPATRQVKLYNSGSFFDPHAIPLLDYPAIAELVKNFERVIVESHPALIQQNCFQFQRLLDTQLEVAIGLETVHIAILEKLNKRMTLDQYQRASAVLGANGIDLRSFILVQPPFMAVSESLLWASRSVDFAISCGATAIALIPTRAGNGATDDLVQNGEFTPPELSVVEDIQDYALSLDACRVFVDTWDIERVACHPCCRANRLDRIRQMNSSQQILKRIDCTSVA